MSEGIYDHLKREMPELMEKLHFQAEVGEFPKSRMDLKAEQLPLEDFDSFSDDPLEFEEYSAALAEDVHELYLYSRFLNRFSEKYQTVSLQLEKGLAKLAGCCVTKAVLEKKGFAFPELKNLEIKPLYCAVSFNFRKVHTAIGKTKNKNYRMWGQLIDIEFGWHALAERLKATEEKILGIRSGKINVDALVERLRLFREDKAPAASPRPKQAIPTGKAYAYPVNGAVIREMIAEPKGTVPGGTASCRRGLSPLAQKKETGIGERGTGIGDPVPQQYDSIRQRKKAERLARKHARQAESKGTEESTQYPVLSTQQKLTAGGCRITESGEKGENTVPLQGGSEKVPAAKSPSIRPGLPDTEYENLSMFEFLKERLDRGSREVSVPVGELLPERA